MNTFKSTNVIAGACIADLEIKNLHVVSMIDPEYLKYEGAIITQSKFRVLFCLYLKTNSLNFGYLIFVTKNQVFKFLRSTFPV